jgi:diguanylate cyclase (GGDEF)-like protein/PAS domain S-box-containing protein
MSVTRERGAGLGAPGEDPCAPLAGDSWKDGLEHALTRLAATTGADRCLVYENTRGPDGQLWMRLVGRGLAVETSGESGPSDRPYFPAFQRWIDVLGTGGEVVGAVAELGDRERAALDADGVRWTWRVPISAAGGWWGFVALDVVTDETLDDEHAAALRGFAAAVGDAVDRDRIAAERSMFDDLYRTIVERGPLINYIDAPDEGASSVYISPQIESLLGYTAEEWQADPDLWPRILHPDDRARALAENARHNETGEPFRLEYRMIHRNGKVVWVYDEARVERDADGKVIYSHGVMLDITARKLADEQVAFHAYHDELTGLPSREMFEELAELSVARAARHDGAVAVLAVDLMDFRLVNDSLGRRAGDQLLVAVAERLREATRETDLVARRGGDQFLLLLADLDAEDAGPDAAVLRAEAAAERVHTSFAAPFVVDGTEVYLAAAIGVGLFPRDADDAASLQRNAETAMFDARRAGGTMFVLSGGSDGDSGARLHFVNRLRKAVEAQRWTLHYQPVVDLADGRMVGVEALIRWIEPDGTIVPPNEFIPLAEELGLIERIGDWVVSELTYQVAAWRELDIDIEVGFNLSPRQFWQPDLARRIRQEFQLGGVDPERVLVEVTETSAMMDPDRAQEVLRELTEAGFAIAIDDFGTGYSSLSRLRTMPVRVLKIDRSFVSNVHEDRQAASIVSAFLELANGLDLVTLAEGIETAEELAFLRERGCRLGQGFYFSKAVPPEEIIAYALGGIPAASALRSA